MKLSILVACAVSLFTVPTENQTDLPPRPTIEVQDNSPGIWNFKEYDQYSKSTVRITMQWQVGDEIHAGAGSGVIVHIDRTKPHPRLKGAFLGRIMTCYHVVGEGTTNVVIQYQNKETAQAKLIAYDEQNDVALLSTWVPAEYAAVKVAKKKANYGDLVRGCGYGFTENVTKPRYFETEIFRATDKVNVLLEDCVPGDSGGPMFNKNGELIGLISSGRIDFQENVDKIYYTGPCSGPSVGPINNILTEYAKKKKQPVLAPAPVPAPPTHRNPRRRWRR